MKKIIVTGCNGQLGRAINRIYAEKSGISLVNTDVGELDITKIDEVMSFVKEVQPYAILNCAGYTAVDEAESKLDLAYRINAIGPRNLAIASSEMGAKLIHISTDYVFPGDGVRPYTEFDAVGPKGAYARSKADGEKLVKDFAEKYFIIRTAWLYGDGNNFARTMLRLSENNDTVNVVNDQFGTPTSAMELARAIAYLEPTDNYGLFHGTCEGQCCWADFAKEIFRLAGKNTTVEAIPTSEYPSPVTVQRPAYSVLENYMLKLTTDYRFADWKDAIAEYIGNGCR